MVICLERGADLYTAQLMPLPLTIVCFTKIQIGVTFLVPAHLGSPGKRAVKRVCVCVCVLLLLLLTVGLLHLKYCSVATAQLQRVCVCGFLYSEDDGVGNCVLCRVTTCVRWATSATRTQRTKCCCWSTTFHTHTSQQMFSIVCRGCLGLSARR